MRTGRVILCIVLGLLAAMPALVPASERAGEGRPQSLAAVSPSYVFENKGIYTDTLTVMDPIGQTSSDFMEVNMSEVIYDYFHTDLDIPDHGTVTGTYVNTHVWDGIRQQIREIQPGAPVYYTTRAAFDADAGPLPFFEDFEIVNITPPAPPFPDNNGTLDEYTDDGYFQPGDIEPGIRFQDNPGPDTNGYVIVLPGFGGNPTTTVCTNTFTDSMDITFFNNDVWAVGMDLQSFFSPCNPTISIYTTGDVLLDTVTAPASPAGIFWGIISGELITRINIFDGANTDGADNIAFGGPGLGNSLAHAWRTEAPGPNATALTLFVDAGRNTGADDNFTFEYSKDGTNWTATGITVNTDVMTEYSFGLPLISAPFYLRVFDTNKDDYVLNDTIYIDQIRVKWFFDSPQIVWVSSPDGGELLMGGGSWWITWITSSGTYPLIPTPITIEYSITGPGGSWSQIASNETNDGLYVWDPVPFDNETDCYIRITAEDTIGNKRRDTSNSSFEIDSEPPLPATNPRAELTGTNDVTIYWTASASTDVTYNLVYFGTNSWDSTGNSYSLLPGANTTGTSFVHVAAGNFSSAEYCYQIRTYDQIGHETRTFIQAAKYTKLISASSTVAWGGWIALGSSLVQSSYAFSHKLQGQGFGMNGFHNWSAVELYDAWDNSDHWKFNLRNGTAGQNEISTINNSQGFWLCAYNSARYTSAGYVSNMTIPLKAGWNLVPYPFAAKNLNATAIRDDLTANCSGFVGGYAGMEIFNRTGYRTATPTGIELLIHQEAFWVRVSADCTWNVINY